MRDKVFAKDLNLQTHNRVSVVAVYGLLLALFVGLWQPVGWVIAAGLAALLLWLNLDLYRFFYEKRGLFFACRVVPMHWLYYFYNAISFGCGLLLFWQQRLKTKFVSAPESLVDGVESDAP